MSQILILNTSDLSDRIDQTVANMTPFFENDAHLTTFSDLNFE
jgi:hypothetical protein